MAWRLWQPACVRAGTCLALRLRPMTPPTWTKPECHELNLSAEIGMYYEDGDGLLEFERVQSDALHLSDTATDRADPPCRS